MQRDAISHSGSKPQKNPSTLCQCNVTTLRRMRGRARREHDQGWVARQPWAATEAGGQAQHQLDPCGQGPHARAHLPVPRALLVLTATRGACRVRSSDSRHANQHDAALHALGTASRATDGDTTTSSGTATRGTGGGLETPGFRYPKTESLGAWVSWAGLSPTLRLMGLWVRPTPTPGTKAGRCGPPPAPPPSPVGPGAIARTEHVRSSPRRV